MVGEGGVEVAEAEGKAGPVLVCPSDGATLDAPHALAATANTAAVIPHTPSRRPLYTPHGRAPRHRRPEAMDPTRLGAGAP